MRFLAMVLAAGLVAAAGANAALAQSYVIQRPGRMPIYVNPRTGGGYAVQAPGQAPIYAAPGPTGTVLQAPGDGPAYIGPGAAPGPNLPSVQAAPTRR